MRAAKRAVKEAVKTTLFFVLFYTGIEYLLTRRFGRNAGAILMYHGIARHGVMPKEVDFHLTRRTFRRHARMLKRRYRIIPLSEMVQMLKRRETPEGCLTLTFDDGYRNNLEVVEALGGTPCTVFLATAFIGTGEWLPLNRLYAVSSAGKLSPEDTAKIRKQIRTEPSAATGSIVRGLNALLSDRERTTAADAFDMLSWDQVRQMAASGVEFGGHTEHHVNLTAEDSAVRRAELRGSKVAIERECGARATTFSYPYGIWNEESRRDVIDAGYDCAVTSRRSLVTAGCDLYTIPRLGFSPRPFYMACELLLHHVKLQLRGVAKPSARTPSTTHATIG